MSERGYGTAAAAVMSRPRLWPTVIRQARALAPAGWWRRRPFLPVPDSRWLAFRMTTAYGDPDAAIDADDLVTWLDWARIQQARDRQPGQTPGSRAKAHG